jgi:hypothetical protein
MTTEDPGDLPEYVESFSYLSGLLGLNFITPCRRHRLQAELIST